MKSTSKTFSAAGALISGIILCNAFVYIEGYLAAIAIPREYFSFFGKDHIRIALFILDIFTFALPYCFMGLIWGVLTSLVLRTRLLSASLWSGLGSLLAMVYLMFFDGASASIYMMGLNDPYMLSQFLVNTMAGPCGVVVGGYFLFRFRLKQHETLPETV